jgi:two-component system chemotaxis sensor kinase CheA
VTELLDRAREDFFSEAQEIIEGLGRALLALDEGLRAGRVDPEVVNDTFRAVHTLKGLAGLFGANRMATLSHELESLLDAIRLGRVSLEPDLLDRLFHGIELYGRILQAERDGSDQAIPEIDALIRQLQRDAGQHQPLSSAGPYDLDPNLLGVLTEYEEHRLRTNIADGLSLFRLRVQFGLSTIDQALDELKASAKPYGEILTYLPTGTGTNAESIELDVLMASSSELAELERVFRASGADIEEIARRPEGAPGPSIAPPRMPTPMPTPTPATTPPSTSIAHAPNESSTPKPRAEVETLRSVAQTVRVDIRKLDRLMNIVGELTLVRTSLGRLVDRLRHSDNRELATDLHRLQRGFDRQLGAMQQGILEVRMVPLGQVFDKLARVVRQISRELDKHVNLVITGAETEIDKLIVEELSDPLMHMMRNAIDHGIEREEGRQAVGKPAVGTIALNAFQKGNHVVIEIEDDGRGIDTEKLLAAGLERGLVSAEDLRTTSRREILNLVFVPGLTTRADVSPFSGRGVGMDVVKTNIGKLGGVIDIQSESGIGTKVTITLPITLAIISALIVEVADRRFAIPLSNIQEAITIEPRHVRTIGDREVMTLRGSTLELCWLSRLFGLASKDDTVAPSDHEPPSQQPPHQAESHALSSVKSQRSRHFVVVTAVGSQRLGFVVDALRGEQDVVIKALGSSLKDVRGIAGATELGDQHLALVIDTPALLDEHRFGGESKRMVDMRASHD